VNVLALIAEDKDRCLRAYVLPPRFLEEYSKRFPRNDGKVEILVGKDASGNAALHLEEGCEPVPIQDYEGITARCSETVRLPFRAEVAPCYMRATDARSI